MLPHLPILDRFRAALGRRHNLRAHFWQSLANYAQQGGGVLLGVILARLLKPEDFGESAYAAALIGLICMPLDWTAAQVLVADRGQNPSLFSEVMSLGLVVVGAKAAATVAVVAWQWMAGEPYRALLVALSSATLMISTIAIVLRSAAEGVGHFKANLAVQLWSLGLSVAVGIAGAMAGWGAAALALMAVAAAVPPFFVYPKYLPHRFAWRFNRDVIRSRGADGFWMWLQGTSSNALIRVDRLFLGSASSVAELGNYTRAFNYGNLSSWALNSFITNPAVVSLANAADAARRRKILATNGLILGGGATASFLVFFFFSDPLVPWIFGEQWRESIPAFRAFAPINFCAAFMYLPITLLLSQKRFVAVGVARFLGLALLAIWAWALGTRIDATRMAAILQWSLLLPGILCWIAAVPYLRGGEEGAPSA